MNNGHYTIEIEDIDIWRFNSYFVGSKAEDFISGDHDFSLTYKYVRSRHFSHI